MLSLPIDYNSVIFNTNSGGNLYRITEIDGLSPDYSLVIENKAGGHGANDYGYFFRTRTIDIRGKIIAVSLAQLEAYARSLTTGFIPTNGYDWLKWQVSGEEAKQIYCRPVFIPKLKEVLGVGYTREFWIELLAVDPRIYSQTQTTSTVYIPTSVGGRGYPKTYPKSYGTARVGGSVNCINTGNFSTLPVVKMYGPLTSPIITNTTDDSKYIKINMVVNAGDYLEIDFNDHTIMLNGTASRYLYLDSGSDWFEILSGNNSITFNDGGGDVSAYCQIIYRSAWI